MSLVGLPRKSRKRLVCSFTMSSSGEDADNAFVMYSDRPEWSDVKPLTQDDGDDPVVRIAYSKECKH